MKKCFKCHEEKALSEFYKHKQMANGYLNKCKLCTKKDVKQRVLDNPEKIRVYEKIRNTKPHRVQARKDYVNTVRGRGLANKAKAKWIKNNPIKVWASTMVCNAVRDGKLSKPLCCSKCQSTGRIEGHHEDYLYPLIVIWLCVKCHNAWHEENGEGLNGD